MLILNLREVGERCKHRWGLLQMGGQEGGKSGIYKLSLYEIQTHKFSLFQLEFTSQLPVYLPTVCISQNQLYSCQKGSQARLGKYFLSRLLSIAV